MRPKIGITWLYRPGGGNPAEEETSRRYMAAVEGAGGHVVPLWHDEPWDCWLEEMDGLLLSGGGDIHPSRYGEENKGSEKIDLERDRKEFAAFTRARERGIPILGICRGMQVINVACRTGDGRGGSLVQALSRAPIDHALDGENSRFHWVKVVSGSQLAQYLGGAGEYQVNSRHHQGITDERLARDLVASAYSADGVVEGLEVPGYRFLLGVQCHPERSGEAPEFEAVLWAFVRVAGERARPRCGWPGTEAKMAAR
ncbi:MAG: gamma-glutamyl-gamma-aminobutyrate hydrolase family protein [Chloroflexota bacterium]